MSVGIEPMGEMVLLEMENAPEKTESGLLLPEEAREKMNVGKVVATGPDVEGLSSGDRVVYRQYSGTKIEWLGIEYMLIKFEDLQAKVLIFENKQGDGKNGKTDALRRRRKKEIIGGHRRSGQRRKGDVGTCC